MTARLAGQESPLPRDGSARVDPRTQFAVEVAVALTDGRLALHDAQDAMIASSGTTEFGPNWTRFHLSPEEPLTPGSQYVLLLDGSTSRELHDASGRAYGPTSIKLRTTGQRPPPPAHKSGKRHR